MNKIPMLMDSIYVDIRTGILYIFIPSMLRPENAHTMLEILTKKEYDYKKNNNIEYRIDIPVQYIKLYSGPAPVFYSTLERYQ